MNFTDIWWINKAEGGLVKCESWQESDPGQESHAVIFMQMGGIAKRSRISRKVIWRLQKKNKRMENLNYETDNIRNWKCCGIGML